MRTGMASTTGTSIAQGNSEKATRAIARVTVTPPAAAKRWFCPSRAANAAWPTSPRVIATTPGPRTPPVIPCNASANATTGKLGQRRKIKVLKAMSTTQVAISSRFARTTSRSSPPGYLTDQAGDAADAEDKPDVFGSPLMSREVGGGDRSKGRLHAGQKEVEPAQSKQALPRRCTGLLRGQGFDDAHSSSRSNSTWPATAVVSVLASAPIPAYRANGVSDGELGTQFFWGRNV